jgi:hypothetical protein
MKSVWLGFFVAATSLLVGCAHPINVVPDSIKIEQRVTGSSERLSTTIGYYIPAELMALEVTTPGGGGDNVRYYPYRDMETGLAKLLSIDFVQVVKLTSAPAYSAQNLGSVEYVIQPELVTSSGSTGFFTWPPTNFTVDLTANFRDSKGKLVANPRVVGVGTAETGERLSDHGFAGRRAMEDALVKLHAAIREQNFVSKIKPVVVNQKPLAMDTKQTAARLTQLKDLFDKGLITKTDYDLKRKEILGDM